MNLQQIIAAFDAQNIHYRNETNGAPLWLAGENFIDSYSDGRANILRCLCDIHAAELGLEVCK